MEYRDYLASAMQLLAADPRVIFLGQSLNHRGNAMSKTLERISLDRRIELPLIEDTQIGMSIGLSLQGYVPISIYPRFDFLILATNQLANQLDKLEALSSGAFKPKVIIRTAVGSKSPINAGLQHTQNYSEAFRIMLNNIDILELKDSSQIMPVYQDALISNRSKIIVEFYSLYNQQE